LISLQTSEEPDETEPRLAEMTVHTLGAGFGEGAGAFLDTAAVMMSLDLVISVDTAIAHLAGTIGRPTWIILKTAPGRHGIPERSDTPWYPSARLFRRKEGQDWTHTMAAVAEALASMARAAVAAPGRC
jgi:ADP-heptose:LPS heptosyltransferase